MIRFVISILLVFVINEFCLSQTLPDEVRINYSTKKKPLKEVLLELSDISEVNISYNEDIIPDVSVEPVFARNQRLGFLLDEILKGTDLAHKIVGNEMVIIKDEYANLEDHFTLSGYLIDSISGERLLFANIYHEYDKKYNTETNEYGYFSIKLPKGEQLITFSYLLYEKQSFNIKMNEDKEITVELNPFVKLNEVVIVDKYLDPKEEIVDLEELPVEKLGSMTSLGGEADILRMAQLQSGVSTGADGFGGMHVRGSDVDHNLILLDGVPVYNAGHALGILSVFNSSVIKSAKLMKNGFPARYGGRLASVMDIRTKDGSMRTIDGDVNVGVAAAKFTLEGPIAKDKASFIFSARRTLLDPFIKEFSKLNSENDGGFNYYFYDLNGKLNFKIGKNSRLKLGWYSGGDQFLRTQNDVVELDSGPSVNKTFDELESNNWQWGNQIGYVKWNSNLGAKTFLNISVHYSKFDFNLSEINSTKIFKVGEVDTTRNSGGSLFTTDILDLGANIDLNFILGNNYSLRLGGSGVRHEFNPAIATRSNLDFPNPDEYVVSLQDLEEAIIKPNILGDEFRAYAENEITLGPLQMNLGLHSSMIVTSTNNFISFQPRTAFNLKLMKRLSLKGGLSYMNQYLHLITNSGLGFPNDVWLPSTDKIKPQESRQVSGGIEIDLGKSWSLGGGGFAKDMSNLIASREGGIFEVVSTSDWEEKVAMGGVGEAYGGEVNLRKRLGKFSGWMNYTYTKATRQFDELNQGRHYPADLFHEHSFNASWLYQINNNMEFTFNWTYGSGIRYSSPDHIFPKNEERPFTIVTFRSLNNDTLPEYHRLDIAFNFYNNLGWGRQKMTIGVYNAYNRKNPLFVELRRNPAVPTKLEEYGTRLFSIMPSFSYSLSF